MDTSVRDVLAWSGALAALLAAALLASVLAIRDLIRMPPSEVLRAE